MRCRSGSVLGAGLLLGALTASSCSQSSAPKDPAQGGETKFGLRKDRVKIGGLGQRKLKGEAIDLRASPDGRVVTALLEAQKPRLEGVPPPMRLGALWAVPTGAGEPVKLGTGVTNMPGGLLFSADSRWAFFLSGYNAAGPSGELLAQDLTNLASPPTRLGSPVSYYVPSHDSKAVAFVEEGVLKVGALPAGPFRSVAGEVATAEFSPDSKSLYFRRRVAAAGGLYQVSLAEPQRPPAKLSDQVGDFRFTADAQRIMYMARPSLASASFELFVADAKTLKSTKVAARVLGFAISKDGKWLVRLEGDTPHQPGELWLGPSSGGTGRRLGNRVQDYGFSSDGSRLVFRQNYREVQLMGEQVERVGELAVVELPEGNPRVIQKVCPNFQLSPDGALLAFTATTFKPHYSRDLYLLRFDAKEPVKLKEWLYEYSFAPASDRLYFRADCTREGRSCHLLSIDTAKPEGPPVEEAEAVYHFRLSEDGGRALYTYAHFTGQTWDVSVVNLKTKARKTIEQDVHLPIHFVAGDGSRIAYVVGDKARPGVYLASDLP